MKTKLAILLFKKGALFSFFLFNIFLSEMHSQAKLNFVESDWDLVFEDNFDYNDKSILMDRYTLAPNVPCGELSKWTWDQVNLDSENDYLILSSQKREQPLIEGCYEYTYDGGIIRTDLDIPDDPNCGWLDDNTGIKYGMMEVRVKLPDKPGAWTAFWSYNGPDEIDYFEHHGENKKSFTTNFHDHCGGYIIPESANYFVKTSDPCSNQPYEQYCQRRHSFNTDITKDFHTFTMVWIPDPIDPGKNIFTIFFDGREVRTETRYLNFCNMDLILNHHVDKEAQYEYSEMLVDYIKIYTPSESQAANFKYMSKSNLGLVSQNPLCAEGSNVVSVSESNQIFYKNSSNGRMEHYYYNNGWLNGPLPFERPEWAVANDIVASKGQTYYIGVNQRIQNYYYTQISGWNHAYVDDDWDWFGQSDNTNGYPANTGCGSLALGISGHPGGQIFYRGTDDYIHSFTYTTLPSGINDWVHAWVGEQISTHKVDGDIAVGPGNQIYYRGQDGRLQNYYYDDGIYKHGYIDLDQNNIDIKVSIACESIVVGNSGKIYYRGNDNKMQSFEWTPEGGWQHSYIIGDYDMSHLIIGGLTIGVDDNIYYTGADGLVQTYTKRGDNWYHSWVNENDNLSQTEFLAQPNAVKVGTSGGVNQLFFRSNISRIYTYYYTESDGELKDDICDVNDQGIILRNESDLEEKSRINISFELFPNLIQSGKITVREKSNLKVDFKVKIYDLSGKLVLSKDYFRTSEIYLSSDELNSGLNLIQVNYSDRSENLKVLKIQ